MIKTLRIYLLIVALVVAPFVPAQATIIDSPSIGGTDRAAINESKAVNEGVFAAAEFATGSSTAGIQEANDACEAAGGGQVLLPYGDVQIDATGQTSPILHVDGVDNGAGQFQGLCPWVGYGAGAGVNNSGSTGRGATEITINNFEQMTVDGNGERIGISVRDADGQVMRDFALKVRDGVSTANLQNIALDAVGAQTAHFHNLKIRDSQGENTMVGMRVDWGQKGSITNVWVDDFMRNLWLGGGTGVNNGLGIHDSVFRSGLTGIYVDGAGVTTTSGCASVVGLFGGIVEGNDIGLQFASGALCQVNIYGTHFENQTTNIEANAAQAVVKMWGGTLQGSATDDFVRTVAQAFVAGGGGNVFDGSDLFDGIEYFHNFNVTAGTVIIRDSTPRTTGLTVGTATIVDTTTGGGGGGSSTALATTYDNTDSGLTAVNVKAAIDENAAEKANIADLTQQLLSSQFSDQINPNLPSLIACAGAIPNCTYRHPSTGIWDAVDDGGGGHRWRARREIAIGSVYVEANMGTLFITHPDSCVLAREQHGADSTFACDRRDVTGISVLRDGIITSIEAANYGPWTATAGCEIALTDNMDDADPPVVNIGFPKPETRMQIPSAQSGPTIDVVTRLELSLPVDAGTSLSFKVADGANSSGGTAGDCFGGVNLFGFRADANYVPFR